MIFVYVTPAKFLHTLCFYSKNYKLRSINSINLNSILITLSIKDHACSYRSNLDYLRFALQFFAGYLCSKTPL